VIEGKPREVDTVVEEGTVVVEEVKQHYVVVLGRSSDQGHVIAMVRPLEFFVV